MIQMDEEDFGVLSDCISISSIEANRSVQTTVLKLTVIYSNTHYSSALLKRIVFTVTG